MTFRAYIFLAIASLAWGGNAVAGKMAVGHVSPMLFTCLRWGLALAVILAISLPQLRRDKAILAKHWLLFLAFGAFGFTGFNALLYTALQYTGAINVSIEQAGIPMMIFIGNYLFFGTRASLSQLVGFALTLAGVAATASHGDLSVVLSLDLNQGDALMLCAVIIYAGYTLGLKWRPPMHWKSLMTATAAGAFVASLPLAAFEAQAGNQIFPDHVGWLAILYTGLIPSLVSQVLYIRGVDIIGPNRAGLFVSLVPIFGTLLAISFAGEIPHLYHIVSLALVIGGIVVAERFKPKQVA